MDELEQIRNRIKERRDIPQSHSLKSFLSLLTISMLFLGFYTYKNELIDYSKMMKYFKTLPSFILSPFEKTSDLFNNTLEVSSSFPYSSIGNDNYTSSNNEVISLFEGLVVYVGAEDNIYKIIISYENNIQVVFDNVKVSYVNLYDRVLRDDVIGTYESYVTITFKENNEDITFEEVIEKY
ncbi:MAG: hypothetical protein IKM20_09850 [Erysipelotrichales bacterium]|nr:hypothetical protein [Erysipelotrichales bacterium]